MGLGTVYLICAIAGGTILVLRVILMVLGLDNSDVAGDMDIAEGVEGHGGGFNILSLQSISGFFTMFGLVGMGLLQINVAEPLSFVGALAAGSITAWATGMIFLSMRRLQSDGTMVIQNAVGQIGTVYLTIPEQGTGVVNVTVQGAQRTLDANSEKGQRIPTGKLVRVVGIAAGKILIVTDQIAEK
jgi:hypothetical protein